MLKLKFILSTLPMTLCGLLSVGWGLTYAAELTVPADLRTDSMVCTPLSPAQAGTCSASIEGRIYYNDSANKLYYCDGTKWSPIEGADLRVGTKIVSAYNSYGATRDGTNPCLGDGSSCNNPKADYTCDGRNDEQTIQQAIDDLATAPGAVYLLEGTYNISGSINLNKSKTSLIGTGRGAVLKIAAGNNLNVINAQNVSGILISQLMVDGNNKTGSGNTGISFSSVTSSKIDQVWVESIDGQGIYFTNSSYNTLSNNNIQSNSGDGIYLNNSSNNIFSHNNIQSNSGYGIRSLSSSNNNTLSHNNIQSNSGDGIYLDNSSNNIFSRNNIQSNSGYGIRFLTSSNNNTIYANNVQDNSYDGIYLSNSSNNMMSTNVICNNGTINLTAAYMGIRISNAQNSLISANYILDNQETGSNRYGIYFDSTGGAANTYIVANFMNGQAYGCSIDSDSECGRDVGGQSSSNVSNAVYTDKRQFTVVPAPDQNPGANGKIQPGVYTYVPLNPNSDYTLNTTQAIIDGKSVGDLLILENIGTGTITINDNANTKLPQNWALKSHNTLTLIWNGNDWVELFHFITEDVIPEEPEPEPEPEY